MTDMTTRAARPHRMGPNKVPVYYEGGAGIDRFRGVAGSPGPEDWVGSVTAFPPALLPPGGDPQTGVSRFEDGASLRDAVLADPAGWLGPDLAGAYDGEPGLLVKLLDAGERLPVHCHPERAVAREKLASPFGKTEGWIIIDAVPGAEVWLGFRDEVAPAQLRAWIEAQDVEAMLDAMNRIPVARGDVLYVPAGAPHSIGAGILLTELQEPTSFSVLAEYRHFGLDEEQATLGLGWDDAVACFDLDACVGERLAFLRPVPVEQPVTGDAQMWRLFPAEAAPFFQAYRAEVRGEAELHEPTFAVLVVKRGSGTVGSGEGAVAVAGGETWVVPYGAGPITMAGDVELLVCRPPATA
jgi:mannose-6-phosphate isomerase